MLSSFSPSTVAATQDLVSVPSSIVNDERQGSFDCSGAKRPGRFELPTFEVEARCSSAELGARSTNPVPGWYR